MEVVLNLRNPLPQILFEEVLEFTSKLDTGRATANDNHVEKSLDFFFGLVLERSRLDTVHDALADLLGVTDFLQKARVVLDSGDAWK